MKKVKFISTILLIVSLSVNVFAGSEEDTSNKVSAHKNIINQLSRNVYSPDFLLQSMGPENLWLKFELTEEGEIHILQSRCTNLRLEQTILKKLNGMRIYTDSSNFRQAFAIKFSFI